MTLSLLVRGCFSWLLILFLQGCQQAAPSEAVGASTGAEKPAEPLAALSQETPAPLSQVAPAVMLQTAELMVEGTSCASCTVAIRRHLNKIAGVSEIREGQTKQHVLVDFDPDRVSPEQIVQAVHEAGYEAEVLVYAKKS